MLVLWLIHKDTGIKSVTGAPQIKNTTPGHLGGSTLVVVSYHKPHLTICAACEANISTSRSLGRQGHLDGTRRKEEQSCVRESHLNTDDVFRFLHWKRFGTFILFRKHFKAWPFWSSACVCAFGVIKSFTSLKNAFLWKNTPDAFLD